MLSSAGFESETMTGMEAAALAVSICAFVLSGGALGWTIFEWHRSGARLKITVTSFATWSPVQDMQWMVAFDVANAGRTMTTASSIGFKNPKGGVLALSEPAAGANPIPKRLDPGESFMFPVSPHDIAKACKEQDIDFRDLTPYVGTGHGTFEGKWLKVAIDVVARRGESSEPE